MKYSFRGYTIFEYDPNTKETRSKVKQGHVSGMPAFDYCLLIDEDYRLLSEFFNRVYRHTQGEDVDLSDIDVY